MSSSVSNIVFIVGPPGAGKTTLAGEICKEGACRRWASWTTREPRDGEVEGEDYFFVTTAEFENAISEDRLLEHMRGPEEILYGLPRPPFKPGSDFSHVAIVAVVSVDELAQRLRREEYTVEIVRLDAPDAVLRDRMISRGDSLDSVQKRESYIIREREAGRDVEARVPTPNGSRLGPPDDRDGGAGC